MTEFLIFLALCAGFSILLARFVRPSDKRRRAERDRRVTATLISETADLQQMTERARSSAEGFGRKPEARQKVAEILKNPVEQYDGLFTLNPFGHDILNPSSRIVPEAYRGKWVKARLAHEEKPEILDSEAVLEINSQQLKVRGRAEPIVAVESGEENILEQSDIPEIAIVSESAGENGKWAFSMIMLSLQDGGRRLVDVESADSHWVRMANA